MLEYGHSIVIHRTPQEVFPSIVTPELFSNWRLDLISLELLTEGHLTKGSRWIEQTNGLGRKVSGEVEVVEYVENELFLLKVISDNVLFMCTYTVAPVAEGSRLTYHLETELPRMLKLVEPVVKKQISSSVEKNFERLKWVLENSE